MCFLPGVAPLLLLVGHTAGAGGVETWLSELQGGEIWALLLP